MAYDFHYTPTGTGVISGKEVLEQTEDAINDLGNTAISGVQEALDKAEQALTNSENAVDDAQTALNTANNAEGVAIQAQTDVGNLSGTVTNIGNRVTTAEGNITNLQGRMTTAEGNITNLQGRMTTAETNIGNLQTAVSTAQATANSAQQTATTARQQSYVFRYSSTALTPSSTNSNTLLDNTDNLKVGDKVIDSSGVLFSITAIDTANSTFTIGTALIDLAQDSDVVHKSGNETVGGKKTFSDDLLIYNSDNSADTPRLNIKTSKYVKGDTTNTDTMRINFIDSNGNNVASVYANKNTNGSQYLTFQVYTTDNNNANITSTIYYYITKSGDKYFIPYEDNQILLGGTVRRWKSIYATNYYYGNDNVEFSTKFVTTDTAQTITGAKTFTDDSIIKTSSPKVLLINTSQTGNTAPSSNTASFLRFDGGTVNNFGGVQCEFLTTGENRLTNYVKDITTAKLNSIQQRANSTTAITVFNADLLAPANDGVTAVGSSSKRWSDVQTKLINGLTPSSLSLPSDRSARVDISGYFTNMASGDTNTYTAPSNGWIYLALNDVTEVNLESQTSGGLTNYGDYRSRSSNGALLCLFPIRSGDVFVSQWYTTTTVTVTNAYFIPCQGNI